MTDRKNIDRLFQEKFKDFEVNPSEHVWENIEAKLNEKKKNRRIIPFWFRLAGVAAALLLGVLIMDSLTVSEDKQENKIVLEGKDRRSTLPVERQNSSSSTDNLENTTPNPAGIEIRDKSTVTQTGSHLPNNTANSGNLSIDNRPDSKKTSTKSLDITNGKIKTSQSIAIGKTRNKIPSAKLRAATETENIKSITAANALANSGNPQNKINNTINVDPDNPTPGEFKREKTELNATIWNENLQHKHSKSVVNNVIDATTSENDVIGSTTDKIITDKKTDSTAIATVEPNALEELLKEKENNVTAKEPKLNRWQVASSVAPIYFSSTSNGSPLDARFEKNEKNYKPTVAYGVGIKYALNKKLSVRSGVSTVKLEYTTADLQFFQTTDARPIANLSTNIQGLALQIDPKPTALAAMARASGSNKFDATLNQKTGYIEVPVEMSYKLIDKKFGIELIGGLSTLFLNENEVSIASPGLNMAIGEADNLNDFHVSTNVGVGFKYSFLKAFQANFEPMFKYQINTFSTDAGNFKPYFFGFYTGISYRF